MTRYALDAIVFLWAEDWVGLGYHAFVLMMLFAGPHVIHAIRDAKLAGAVTEA